MARTVWSSKWSKWVLADKFVQNKLLRSRRSHHLIRIEQVHRYISVHTHLCFEQVAASKSLEKVIVLCSMQIFPFFVL